jgi:glycolate oxidase FAD binding subunit
LAEIAYNDVKKFTLAASYRDAVDNISIDQSAPMPVKKPATVPELGALIAEARSSNRGVYPFGGATTLDIGLPPLKPGIGIETGALNRIVDYPARDMTITVQGGITIARLQEELAKEGQWLPIDVAEPDRATLGGSIALNKSGPHRWGWGTLRDYVIGISFATDEGAEVKAGGRVVKNVAGYDLMKLQIGAVGTLGIVTQATLKVKPRPESSAALAIGCTDDVLAAALDLLHASRSRPVVVELLNREAWHLLPGIIPRNSDPDWIVAVGFEEKDSTVKWQVSTLLNELKPAPVREPVELSDSATLWASIAGLQTRADSRFIGKASILPSKVASYVRALSRSNPGMAIHAHALNGIVWCHARGEEPIAVESAAIRRGSPSQKRAAAVWGKPPADWELMRHIKRTLDPKNVFNPGRLFGDL